MARVKADEPVQPVEDVEIPLPRVDVLERALIDPFGAPSSPIELRDPQFITHWCNTELNSGAQLYKYEAAGWQKTRPEYLLHPDRFHFNVSPDGYVTRGERHREILMYTTKIYQKRREWAKTEENMKRMRMSTKDIQEAASVQFGKEGDQAAEYLGRHIGGVTDSFERIQVQK